MKKVFFLVVSSFLLFVGCENPDIKALQKAQQCLDQARTPQDAQACRQYVQGLTSQKAKSLSCAIETMAAGIDSSTMQSAFVDMTNTGPNGNKEAALLSHLSVGDKTTADTVFNVCNESDVPGLEYIAGLVRVATIVDTLGSGANFSADLSNCATNTSSCNPADIGETAVVLADSYCTGDNANTNVCNEINNAVANGGGDYSAIGSQLLSLLNTP
ncbi:MAG: hypothetical protein D6797_07640 [Bdellovibrio sp.]|nr:MAG: hypothetical protein D6797_07640 [Bdellovibrio sp.]